VVRTGARAKALQTLSVRDAVGNGTVGDILSGAACDLADVVQLVQLRTHRGLSLRE